MQRTYTLEELAKFLRRPEKDLKKLAEKDVLKGRKVQGNWVFALPDVVLWMENEMTAQMGTDGAADLEEAVSHVASAAPESEENALADLLSADAIVLDFAAKTKESVIRDIVKIAAETGKLWDPDAMADALREREEMAATALDCGVAILHPRRPQAQIIAEDFLALATTRRGVPFGGGFDNLTDVFFLLCCQTDAAYLRALGRLARVLKEPGFLDALRECAEPFAAQKLLAEYEKATN